MKILLTGANGYLGMGITKMLLDLGHEVIAADCQVDFIDKRANRIECNIFEVNNPYEYFQKPDVLLHLAWRDGFIHYSETHIDDLPKHYSFIKSMAESGCLQIAVLGSMHEVGPFEGEINESTSCHPITPYGIAKNALRELCEMICKKDNCVLQWLRGYYIVGNTKYGSSIFSKIVRAEEEGKSEFPFTMGQNQYDFIDYDEFCLEVALTVIQKKVAGIINICSGRPEKLAERVEKFILENKYNIKLHYGVFPDRPYDSKAVWGNSTKIEEIMRNNKENKICEF